jgi:transposase
MVRPLARVIGSGIEAADMLAQEVLSRNMRDRRAVARYAGLTGSPDESGTRRRQKVWLVWQRSSAARHDPIGAAISIKKARKIAAPKIA